MPEEVYDTGPATNAEFDTATLRFIYTSLVTPGHGVRRGPRHRRAHASSRPPRCSAATIPADYETGRLWATRRGRHPGADLLRAPGRASPTTARRPACSTATAPTRRASTRRFSTLRLSLLDRGLRVRHRPRARRRRARPALVRRRQAAAQAQHLHRLHRLRRAPRRRGPHRPRAPRGPRRLGRRPAHGRDHQPAPRPVRRRRRRGALRRLPHHDPRRDPAAHRHRVGGVGQPGGRPGGVRLHEGLQPLRQRRRRGLPHHPRHRRPQRPAGVVLGARQVGAARCGRAPPAASPIYLKTEMGAGHQGPSGRYDAWKDEAFVFAFMLDALGLSRPS